MVRSKDSHIIEVHYPETEEEIADLKKRIGSAYSQFIKHYILTLPINDKEKNKLYAAVVENLIILSHERSEFS